MTVGGPVREAVESRTSVPDDRHRAGSPCSTLDVIAATIVAPPRPSIPGNKAERAGVFPIVRRIDAPASL